MQTGEGALIDVSMLDASMAFMTSALTPYLITGKTMKRLGNTGYSALPTSALFEAGDGRHISLGVVQENQFVKLARVLGKEEWLDDERYHSNDARRANFDGIYNALAEVFSTRDSADWERELSNAGIPCGKIRHVGEAVELAGEGALLDLPIDGLPDGAGSQVPNAGFRMQPGQPGTDEAPPRLDANREEILAWLASGDGSQA